MFACPRPCHLMNLQLPLAKYAHLEFLVCIGLAIIILALQSSFIFKNILERIFLTVQATPDSFPALYLCGDVDDLWTRENAVIHIFGFVCIVE